MRKRAFVVGVSILGFGSASSVAVGATWEEISEKITKASEKCKSFSAKVTTTTEMIQEDFSMVSKTDGTTEWLRKGESMLMRNDSKSVTETTMMGNTTKQESETLSIADGSYSYTLSDMGGAKTAYKSKIAKSDDDPLAMVAHMGEIKVLPDSSLDGHAVWVVEALPKMQGQGQGKTLMYYHKDSGQMIKMVSHGEDGKPLMTMVLTDIKVNPSINADRFVFKAPAGVQVQEMP